MKIDKIIKQLEILEQINPKNIEITDIASDSRKCSKDSLFIAINGFDTDGHKFIEQAVDNGSVAVIFENKKYGEFIRNRGIYGIRVTDSRLSAPVVANAFFEQPSRKINLVGVTGTNGKTTIATLLYRLFKGMGYGCGLLSTIANYVEDEKFETVNTTQDPITVNRLLQKMIDRGCEYCFMEVSSQALHQGRVNGLYFKGAIFTNLTHDHLDYHKTYPEYIRCKKLLFDSLSKDAFALINIDDKNGEIMIQNCVAKVYRYSSGKFAEFRVKMIEKSIEGSLLNINGTEVWTRFIGEHNAHNILAVYGAAMLLGGKKEEVLTGISALEAVPGRLEYFKGYRNMTAVIDYAHTPDALENVLKTLREIAGQSMLITLFGCGGNRDKTKRPEMGAIAAKYSDRLVITSDNPRFENPEEIMDEIKSGLDAAGLAKSIFITDRAQAIKTAISTASANAIILLAGKGHENYQIINGVKKHFDDKEIAIEDFKNLEELDKIEKQ